MCLPGWQGLCFHCYVRCSTCNIRQLPSLPQSPAARGRRRDAADSAPQPRCVVSSHSTRTAIGQSPPASREASQTHTAGQFLHASHEASTTWSGHEQ